VRAKGLKALWYFWRSFRNCEDENFEERDSASDSLKGAVRQAISITDETVKRVGSLLRSPRK
jgi:hypothetical protein